VAGILEFLYLSAHALRVGVATAVPRVLVHAPFVVAVVVGEALVALWMRAAPIRGRVGPGSTRAKLAAALGRDMPLVTDLLGVVMTCFVLLGFYEGGAAGFVAASVATLTLHAVLKRLADARLESERRRLDLLVMREALDRRQRLAAIGQTASGVFHQIARHHGAIGIFAHLLARRPSEDGDATVREHAERILTSLEEAKRVIDELLRFGQDRALNLYPQSIRALLDESVAECGPHAARRRVELAIQASADCTVMLDKHKLKQALGNVLDNAIEVTPAGARVEIGSTTDGGMLRIGVRDHGPGVDLAIRARLFTPFSTTKPDGIGLGLALARELLEAHGGTIAWRDAAPGTEFVLSVPLEPNGRS
jgi:signal transduction histidine kinase